ncbi:MAG: hypothetical protein PVI86_17000 [Phycisphaerae bacterium]|jgi:hypothetical protein
MHDQFRQDLTRAIDEMSDAEKLQLIEELIRSLQARENGNRERLTPAAKQRLVESVRRISELPKEGPGQFSGRDHDRVLYGPSGEPGPQV